MIRIHRKGHAVLVETQRNAWQIDCRNAPHARAATDWLDRRRAQLAQLDDDGRRRLIRSTLALLEAAQWQAHKQVRGTRIPQRKARRW